MSIDSFYNSTVEVQQVANIQTSGGGLKKIYSARIIGLRCRITPTRTQEVDQFGKSTVRISYRLYCDATAANRAIVESDRIVYGSQIFDVVGIANPGQLNHHLEIDLEDVK